MTNPRWHKVLSDLKVSRSRTILVILSIAIGIFALGTILTSRIALQSGIDESFDAANPASAVLMTESFDSELVEAARSLPEIADAEGRVRLNARVQGEDGTWHNLSLSGVPDFANVRIDRIYPETGSWPPATGEILLERLSLEAAGVSIGNEVIIETPDGTRQTVRVGGTVYDPGEVDPSISSSRLAGYVTLPTMEALGQDSAFNELRVMASEQPRDLAMGEQVAGLARDQVLEPNGVAVQRIAVHDTPRYHSAALGDALLLILGLMGALVLLLGLFLVVNTVNALLAQQVRQIGVMKAIGGRRRQIAGVYLMIVLAYGLLAVVVAVPLSALAAREFVGFFAGLLNVDVGGPWFPPEVIAIQLAIGLVVPLLAALIPVLRGTSLTVREAITSYGISERPQRGLLVGRMSQWLGGISRPVLLSLRNTFRRRGRLALTLATLTLGGAIFASVATVQASLSETFEEVMQYSSYDVAVTLQDPAPANEAVAEASELPGVTQAEGWIASNASRIRPDGTQNSNIWVMAAPAGTDLIRPTLVDGRWLEPGDREALVVNVDFLSDESDVKVGDLVTLKIEGEEVQWPIVGTVTPQLMGPVVFAPYEGLSEALGIPGQANQIMLVTDQHDTATQTETAQLAEQQLRSEGFPVAQVDTVSEMREGTQSAFDILVVLLLIVGVLLAAVGSIGLMGAMSLNVIERTREIGVMRAIGASNGIVARVVLAEGLVVGVLGWILATILMLPLSWGLSYAIGVAFLQVPLNFTFSMLGALLWLVLVVVLSIAASILPARTAWRLSVREVLAYE